MPVGSRLKVLLGVQQAVHLTVKVDGNVAKI